MKSLNEKRLRLLQLVAKSQQCGEFPLVREMAQTLGYKGESSITRMLDVLVGEGYLHKHGGGKERRHRLYRLTAKGQRVLGSLFPEMALCSETQEAMRAPVQEAVRPTVPVLGHIPAGPLAEAVQECEEWIDPGDGLRVQSGDFFLRVTGQSMTGDGILPDDLVLIRPAMQINSGEIAAVQIHSAVQSDATLKHIHWQAGKKTVRLRASNAAYDDMVLPAGEVEVIGAYRGLLRRVNPKTKSSGRDRQDR